MTVKCCGTCSRVTELLMVRRCWCLLVDEPVDYNECCGNWSERE